MVEEMVDTHEMVEMAGNGGHPQVEMVVKWLNGGRPLKPIENAH
jgi:hypothetical protein